MRFRHKNVLLYVQSHQLSSYVNLLMTFNFEQLSLDLGHTQAYLRVFLIIDLNVYFLWLHIYVKFNVNIVLLF